MNLHASQLVFAELPTCNCQFTMNAVVVFLR